MPPSTDELNAGFDALQGVARNVVAQLIPHIPFMFRDTAQTKADEYLRSPEGRAAVLDGTKKILVAAEKARTKT